MKFPEIVDPISYQVGSDLSESQYCLAVISAGKLALPSAGGRVTGVMLTKGFADGDVVSLGILGPQPCIAGGSFSAGNLLKATAAGKVVLASGSDIAAGSAIAVALQDSAGDTEKVAIMLLQHGAGIALTEDVETVTSGALSVTKGTSFLSVTNTVAFTIADGPYAGFRKRIECSAVSGTPVGTLTITNPSGTEEDEWVFTAVGQALELVFLSDGWHIIEVVEAGTDTPAAASTINPLVRFHNLAIDGTDDWILPSGSVPGQIQTFYVSAATNTPVGTVSGLFYDEDASADGVDIQLNAAADLATVQWNGARWVGIQLVSAAIA